MNYSRLTAVSWKNTIFVKNREKNGFTKIRLLSAKIRLLTEEKVSDKGDVLPYFTSIRCKQEISIARVHLCIQDALLRLVTLLYDHYNKRAQAACVCVLYKATGTAPRLPLPTTLRRKLRHAANSRPQTNPPPGPRHPALGAGR
jgi:hypothetical protein